MRVAPIPLNGFLVAPSHLYSRNEVVNIQTNALEAVLPVDITTGSSWAGAPVPGGPALARDNGVIYANNSVIRIDVAPRTAEGTDASGHFMSDIAITPDDSLLLVSAYSFASGPLQIYDTTSNELVATISGLGDFSGEVGFLSDHMVVVGDAGNPVGGNGGVTLLDLSGEPRTVDRFRLPLADNLLTDGTSKIIASSGEGGVAYFELNDEGRLERAVDYVLGVNFFEGTTGAPLHNDIRRMVFKPGIAGDTNGDGIVNIDDLNNVRNTFGCALTSIRCDGDTAPFDGDVDVDDLNAVRNNFGAGRLALTNVDGRSFDGLPTALNATLGLEVNSDRRPTGTSRNIEIGAGGEFANTDSQKALKGLLDSEVRQRTRPRISEESGDPRSLHLLADLTLDENDAVDATIDDLLDWPFEFGRAAKN